MRAQKKSFIQLVSQHYGATGEQLRAFTDVWDWERLSSNTEIAWTDELINAHRTRWRWKKMVRNPALPWSPSFVRHHVSAGDLDWAELRWQPVMLQTPELASLCLPRWSRLPETRIRENDAGMYRPMSHMSWGEGATEWGHDLVRSTDDLDWDCFSAVTGFPWTTEFVAEHADRLNWRAVSWNTGMPWSFEFLERFANRLDWNHLPFRIPWTIEIIREFADRINWRHAAWSSTPAAWPPEVFDEFPDRLWWAIPDIDHGGWEGTFHGLINHENLEWTVDRFERLRPHVDAHFQRVFDKGIDDYEEVTFDGNWTQYCSTANWAAEMFDHLPVEEWGAAAHAATTPWTHEFIERHIHDLDVHSLVRNDHFPLMDWLPQVASRLDKYGWQSLASSRRFVPSVELIEQYREQLPFRQLGRNPNLTDGLIDRYADQWEWDSVAGNEMLTMDTVVRYAGRWSRSAWRTLSQHALAQEPGLDASLPWRWSELVAGGRSLRDHLDDETLLAFLQIVRSERTMERNLELEATIADNLVDRSGFEVYADWLQQRDDPQGDLIALMCAQDERAPEAIAKYRDLLELGNELLSWRYGFVDEAYELRETEWRRLLAARAFRFVRGLGFSEHCSRRLTEKDLAFVATLSNLQRLTLRHVPVADLSPILVLRDLRDVRLDHGPIATLEHICTLPKLEQLGLWDTRIQSLAGIERATTLRAVHIGHNPITDLSPLSKLEHLEEIDLRYTQVADLTPLHGLEKLRLVFCEMTNVDDAEREALQAALPNVTLASYEDWPAGSTVLPFWQRRRWEPLPPPD